MADLFDVIDAPASWTTTIGAICDAFGGDVQTGPFGSQLHASDYSEDGTPVVMPQDMVNGQIVCGRIVRVGAAHVRQLHRHVLRSGDIVFSRRGDVTRFAVVTASESGWLCGTGSIRIRLNCPEILIEYARTYLRQEAVGKWLMHRASGVTMPNLNTSIIRALPFVYPPLPEQRRIAEVLDRAETLRAQRRQALALLDVLAESTFLDMFGDFENNSRGWPIKALDELNDDARPIGYGILMPGPDRPDGTPYVRVVDMKNGEINVGSVRRTTVEINHQYRRSTLRAGDLLISIRGHVGRMARVPAELDGANITQDSARIAPKGVDPAYLLAALRSSASQRWMQKRTRGVAVQGLNIGDLRLLPILLPPLKLQEQFSRTIHVISEMRQFERVQALQLNALFASLQHRAFRGEL